MLLSILLACVIQQDIFEDLSEEVQWCFERREKLRKVWKSPKNTSVK